MAPTLARTVPAFVEPRSTAASKWRLPLGLGVLVVWAGWISKVDLRLLWSAQTWRSIADLVVRLFPPDLSPDFLKVALQATLTTAATALVATALASVVALPLGVLASGRLWRTGITSAAGKGWSGQAMTVSQLGGAAWHGSRPIHSGPCLGALVCGWSRSRATRRNTRARGVLYGPPRPGLRGHLR